MSEELDWEQRLSKIVADKDQLVCHIRHTMNDLFEKKFGESNSAEEFAEGMSQIEEVAGDVLQKSDIAIGAFIFNVFQVGLAELVRSEFNAESMDQGDD